MKGINQENLPDYFSAWEVDNPEWVKQRKKDWKKIKESPGYLWCVLPRKQLPLLRKYFMTGIGINPQKLESNPNYFETDDHRHRPLAVQDALLFEIWLSANKSEEHIQRVLNRCSDGLSIPKGKAAFSRIMMRFFDDKTEITGIDRLIREQGSMFAGSDEYLYRLLAPTHLYATDQYDEFSPEAIKLQSGSCISAYSGWVKNFLTKEYLVNSIAPLVLEEWLCCVPSSILKNEIVLKERPLRKGGHPLSYFDFMKKNYLIPSIEIHKNPGDFDSVQVDFAERILEAFKTMTVNEEVDNHVREIFADLK